MVKIDSEEILNSTAKSIFGVVPFAGNALDELFFEYNGRIKQKRLNHFVEILAESFSQDSGINIDNIKTEDFSDLFESVLRRVVQTKSELKLNRFKDILMKELNVPTKQTELIEIYLDLINSLSEEELSILYYHKHFDLNFEKEIDRMNVLKDKLNTINQNSKKENVQIDGIQLESEDADIQNQIKVIEDWLDDLRKYKTADYYNLDEHRFMFYKQRLFSKGLLIDNRMDRIGNLPFYNMGITEFGMEFIAFIKVSE